MTACAPIILFAHRRAAHLERAVKALGRCPEAAESNLFLFSDGPRDKTQHDAVEATRAVARSVRGFRSVHLTERENNLGLSRSIISGVTEVLSRFDRAVVLEDDIEVSADFLSYMNRALDHYAGRPDVFSVSGYLYPVRLDPGYRYDTFLFRRFSCWGWGTWSDPWRRIDWRPPDRRAFLRSAEFWRMWRVSNDLPEMMLDLINGRNASWAVLFNRTQIENNGYSVHPVRSLSRNIGMDGTGTHRGQSTSGADVSAEARGLEREEGFRFANDYDERLVKPLERYFHHGIRRRMKNILVYGRYF